MRFVSMSQGVFAPVSPSKAIAARHPARHLKPAAEEKLASQPMPPSSFNIFQTSQRRRLPSHLMQSFHRIRQIRPSMEAASPEAIVEAAAIREA